MVFNNIQYLRAFAAIVVVLYHSIGAFLAYYPESTSINIVLNLIKVWGACGVDIFFVISGFILYHTFKNVSSDSFVRFFLKRLIRIAPLYFLLTLAFSAIMLFFPSAVKSVSYDMSWMITSLFFLSQLFFNSDPILYVGWSLEWEMFFYILFVILFFLKKNEILSLFIIFSVLTITGIFSTNFIALEFFLGILVCQCLHYKKEQFRKFSLLIFIAGFSLLFYSLVNNELRNDVDRFILWGIPSFLVVLGAALGKNWESFVMKYLGEASYSIYLIQVFSIPIFFKITIFFPFWNSGDIFNIIFCTLFTVIAGVVLHITVEKPVIARVRNHFGFERNSF
jgi:exopolysaccharide production protein ExoZ